jgi:hypothetical protein
MAQQLVVIAGPDKGRVFPLNDGEIASVGRSLKTDICLSDPFVSRKHCRILIKGSQVIVMNWEGSTGTFINDAPITEQQLEEGDCLCLGRTRLRFTTGASPKTNVPADAVLSPGEKAPALDFLARLAGTTMSRYEISRVLGKGKTGVVFQATDTEEQRIVALKVLNPALSQNDTDRRRLVRAMKTMMPLEHPNLVNIFNAGKTGAYCWIAMEYVQGQSLAQIVTRIAADTVKSRRRVWGGSSSVLPRGWWLLALRCAIHLCRALEFAHEHQIIHRNLTPKNILVREPDHLTKLGDLMLAKALEGPLAEDITRTGELLGELEYMSPERTYGNRRLDGRSDIYGLGAAVYAMLAGRPPFVSQSRRETISMIRDAELVKPRSFQPTLPQAFEEVVLRMLAKRPEDRFQTASQALAPLEEIAKKQRLTV